MQAYDELKVLIDSVADDVAKTLIGNKAAGTRLRKAMQAVKAKANEVRAAVLAGQKEKVKAGE